MNLIHIPRPEFPKPQWQRENWQNLNGTWEFDFDFGRSALDKGLQNCDKPLSKTITVPFCPESKLSGIGYTDFIDAVCYRRSFALTESDLAGRVFLHFGAVDYHALVYVNGKFVGEHKGGYSSFKFEITNAANVGENTVFVYAKDDTRNGKQPSGKQSHRYESFGCLYTRTTGIWQTVWLEMTPKTYIKNAKFYPDIHDSTLTVIGETVGAGTLTIASAFEGKPTGAVTVDCHGGMFKAVLVLEETHLWEIGKGGLYDLTFTFGEDTVHSYFGLRETRMNGMKYTLNGKTVFQRTVLDQGFYPDGIYTAPTDQALENDIHLSLAAGFNGARLHEKVFEARFLYHADRLGYIVWGEHANWGFDCHRADATEIYLNEWAEIIDRDFNSPSLIGWCPFNETWDYIESEAENTLISSIYTYTKTVDPTRPCIDASGGNHVITDIYDTHDYDQNPETFKAHYDKLAETGELYDNLLESKPSSERKAQAYCGEPVFLSEYGGIQWNMNGNTGWGYGAAPTSEEEFIARYKGLTDALLDNPSIMGFCYTQLYDVEQEINGLYTYERQPKFDMSIFKAINTRKAAIE